MSWTPCPSRVSRVVRRDSCLAIRVVRAWSRARVSSGPRSRTAAAVTYWALPGSNWSRNHNRCWANDSGRGRGWGLGGMCAAARAGRVRDRDDAGQPGDGGVEVQGARGQVSSQDGTQPGGDLDGQDGVPAELEEVVVDAGLAGTQDLGPDRRDGLLGRGPRRDVPGG